MVAKDPMTNSELHVQRLVIGPYLETGVGRKPSWRGVQSCSSYALIKFIDNNMGILGSAGKKSDAYLLIGIVGVLVLLGAGTHYYAKWEASQPENIAKVAEEKAKQEEEDKKAAAELEAFKKTPAGTLCEKHPTWTRVECERTINGNIWIGMDYEMLVYQLGKPLQTNVSNNGRGDRYQYCWRGIEPSCFYDDNRDGKIDAYN